MTNYLFDFLSTIRYNDKYFNLIKKQQQKNSNKKKKGSTMEHTARRFLEPQENR